MKYNKNKWFVNHARNYITIVLVALIGNINADNIAYVSKTGPSAAGAGKEWPNNRFVVNGDCITDKLTGLMWVKNGNLLGDGTWGNSATSGTAQYKVAQMNTNPSATGYHLCGYNDWRLPAQTELLSLFNYAATNGNQADWLNSAGFSGVNSWYYWSSTSGGNGAWVVDFSGTTTSLPNNDGSTCYIWAVRGGK